MNNLGILMVLVGVIGGRRMLKTFLEEMMNADVALTVEETEYLKRHEIVVEGVSSVDPIIRFSDAYLVKSDKETEEIIEKVDIEFFNQPLSYLVKHKNEYIYLESNWFDALGVDAVSLELDDVFKTYGVMLGLKQKKNVGPTIKGFFEKELQADTLTYAAMFNGDEGIWDLNFSLNFAEGFSEELTIGEAYLVIYQLLFKLVSALQEGK
jgi:hypothetical protein